MKNMNDFLTGFYNGSTSSVESSDNSADFISVPEFKTLKGVQSMDIISVERKDKSKKDFIGMFSPEGELLGFVNPDIDLNSQLTIVIFNDEDSPRSYYLTNKKSNNDIIGKL